MEIDSSDDEEGGKEKGDTGDSDSDAETGDKQTTERRYQYTRLEHTAPASIVTQTPGGKRPTLAEMISGSVKPTIGELVRADPEVPENFFDWLKP